MAARQRAPKSEATPAASASEPTPDPAAELPEAEVAASLEPPAPPQPVRRYQIARPAPYRAGGHVLTERGWELDTTSPEQES